jgi:hypothetical protein
MYVHVCPRRFFYLNFSFFFVCLMVLNAAFKNISAISWLSVLLVEETGGLWENHRPVASHWQTLSHNVVHLAWSRFKLTFTSVVIGTDCIGSCKSNYPLFLFFIWVQSTYISFTYRYVNNGKHKKYSQPQMNKLSKGEYRILD